MHLFLLNMGNIGPWEQDRRERKGKKLNGFKVTLSVLTVGVRDAGTQNQAYYPTFPALRYRENNIQSYSMRIPIPSTKTQVHRN